MCSSIQMGKRMAHSIQTKTFGEHDLLGCRTNHVLFALAIIRYSLLEGVFATVENCQTPFEYFRFHSFSKKYPEISMVDICIGGVPVSKRLVPHGCECLVFCFCLHAGS